MSRVGKQIIDLPAGVQVHIVDGAVTVTGAQGTLVQALHPHVIVAEEPGVGVRVTVVDPKNGRDRALWGLFQRLIANMVEGVTRGFEKQLEVNGVGYKVASQGSTLTLSLGFSHPVSFPLPQGVSASVEKNVITLRGIDKQLVGQTAARVRALRKPEPYKGKGIKYVGEVIRRKAGKAAKAGAK